MAGSNNQSKTTEANEIQLPLKGFMTSFTHAETGKEMLIEGMGEGRFRIHAKKGLKTPKTTK